MAKCKFCNREMLTANGCTYKHIKDFETGKTYNRIKVGDKGDFYEGEDNSVRCGDCGAKVGYYHHPYCDLEVSPVDGGQLLMNDVEYKK